MTPYSPELIAGARAIYELLPMWDDDGDVIEWERLERITKYQVERYCQAFAAGLAALLPVSTDVTTAIENRSISSFPKDLKDELAGDFTAAIKHLIGRDA